MSAAQDSLEALESQCLKLEESHRELQRTIYHWHEQEAEYDGLKSDIAALDENCTQQDIIRVARQYGGPVVTDDEIRLFTGEKQGVARNRRQVEGAIARRIDYIHENQRVLEKRATAVENQLQSLHDKISDLSRNGEYSEQSSENLPITDIVEQLDDNGDVISSTTRTPEQDASKIFAALKEAGVDKLLQKGLELRRQGATGECDTAPPRQIDEIHDKDEDSKATEVSSQNVQKDSQNAAAAQTSDHNESVASSTQSTELSITSTETDLTDDSQTHEQIEDGFEMPEIDESPEEAALRMEILRYGMEEVGAVVAELELDTDAEEVSVDDEYDENYAWSDDDDEEDEYGRSTKSLITDNYRAQMEELERRLNIKGIRNIGPSPAFRPSEPQNTKAETSPQLDATPNVPPATIKATDGAPKKKSAKKKVAFADSLDIAPDSEPKSASPPPRILESSETAIKDEVIERSISSDIASPPAPTTPTKRVSRFKAVRRATEPTVSAKKSLPSDDSPSHPPAKLSVGVPSPDTAAPVPPQATDSHDDEATSQNRPLMADRLIEREPNHHHTSAPDPDDFDEALHHQEINTEFYKMRNRKIAQEGGFTRESLEDVQTVPLDEDENGLPTRKPSRFMAARMKRI
ncbi:GTPase required for pre-60S ribosomal subunit nuclear export and maturation [Ascosphaera pollenicola]|nr:GTPase required for pre-60S ribosomal subunit nuclear export and maturation [Ascosphaera pollenicola]